MSPTTGAPDHRRKCSTACFSVSASTDPSVLPRVLETLAKSGQVPNQWHSRISESPEKRLEIDFQVFGMETTEAEQIVRALRRIVFVDTVLTSFKHVEAIA